LALGSVKLAGGVCGGGGPSAHRSGDEVCGWACVGGALFIFICEIVRD